MRITIQKLGMIQKAEIDLRPFTIFIGPNNAGKTWLAYALAGIFGPHGRDEYIHAYAAGKLPRSYPLLDDAIEKVLTEGNATIDLYKFAEDYGEAYFQHVADFAQHWMPEFMSTQLAHFDDMKVSISLAEEQAGFLKRVEQYSLQTNVAGGLLSIRKKRGDKIVYVYTSTEDEERITERLPAEAIKERLVQSVARVLHRSLYPQICVFPTERTTLVTFPFGNRTRERMSSSSDEQAREAFETIRKALQQLPELSGSDSTLMEQSQRIAIGPVNYFMSMISSTFRIGSKQVEKRKENAKSNTNIQQYIQLADVLERQILSGDLDFSTPEPDPRRDILFQPTPDATVEIPIASSMVKELSPLVLYLRYLAEPGELLIIDEPEMNLHPEAQTKIIEFLAMLVNAGLRVLITTHSPYMLDHLTNLIRAAEYEKEEQSAIADQFFLQRSDAFIPQDQVSVYLVDHGEADNILQDGKINWGTFGDVSDRVAQLHYEL